MKYVKSTESHGDFITGRGVQDCVYQEDLEAGTVIGRVEDSDVRSTDIVISQTEHNTLAQEIQTYNIDNPLPVPPPIVHGSPISRDEFDAASLEEKVNILARRQGLVEPVI
mgnify:CR=1 FL=1